MTNPDSLTGTEAIDLILAAGAYMAAMRQAESLDELEPDSPEDEQ